MVSIFFQPIDCCSNALTGSKIVLKPFNPPYTNNSNFGSKSPINGVTDLITGSLLLNNVISGYYKMSVSPSNYNSSNVNNFNNMLQYIFVPTGSGNYNVTQLFISSSALTPQ